MLIDIDVRGLERKAWQPEDYIGRKAIYAMAFDHYGCEAQRMMAIEEMSELIKELCKVQRDETTMWKLVDELADVEIMIEQLKMMFDAENAVRQRMDEKLLRLTKRIEAELEELENDSAFVGDGGTDLVCDVGE